MDQMSSEQLAVLAQDQQSTLQISLVISFSGLAVISVCLRLFTRLRWLGHSLGWEDYTIVLSTCTAVVCTVCQVLQADAGSGRHAVFVPYPEGVTRMLKWLFWSIVSYNISLCATKVSILLQYHRIFTVAEMRIPLGLLMAFIIIWGTGAFFTSIFTCIPIHAYWDVLAKPTATCLKSNSLWYMNASINMVTDLAVAFLPVRVIWNLQIARNQKIALIAVLTIGWFVCVVSVLRLIALVSLSTHPDDSSYYSAPAAYWSGIEINLAIVCASLPALKPLIVRIIPGFSSRNSGRGVGTCESSRVVTIGTRCRNTARQTAEFELEAGVPESLHPERPLSTDVAGFDKNIYITRHYEQHFENSSRISEGESQTDLIVNPKPTC
ncbi:hypothetical protein P3342_010167 [Pyrenophora teres f. teres]|uniref:Rhodopsin domain-containing protein n=1 Tax=Pyrenophora teres f. teres TaxID=97479 RepID=A0A6S6WA79_9PLEO|nr:hypothetical protein HRS9139_08313 [Pyrenophora teres f. teres]KAE8834296.1 hypothetical protein PTNB85_05629 [Pyrenophora teres f. teres]KAE8858719.1 hypothetical protein PTNB73_08199 [Pyrenophora teres f. teres]KAE8860584.1 hypothetical protein PTNB29_05679 [Pyrenophora teres f. teres]KAK1912564.1 hypothetical protein P3342_010167 [Pyrenophora teres f. teres]